MKFDNHKPIVFARSAAIPDRYRQAVRDGVLDWNKAFGRPLLQVIDAPDNVTAPSPRYNAIQWLTVETSPRPRTRYPLAAKCYLVTTA